MPTRLKDWIKIKVFDLWVLAAVKLLGAKVNREKIVEDYKKAPERSPSAPAPCEACCEYVQIAGRSMHVSELKAIEDEWIERGIIG